MSLNTKSAAFLETLRAGSALPLDGLSGLVYNVEISREDATLALGEGKPKLLIRNTGSTLAALQAHLLQEVNLPYEYCMEYLYHIADLTVDAEIPAWESGGVGLKGANVSCGPKTWVDMRLGDLSADLKLAENPNSYDEKLNLGLLIRIFCCIRISMSHENAKAAMIKRFEEMMQKEFGEATNHEIPTWGEKPEFIMMASAFDAFWWTKPRGKYSPAKMATLVLRGRGSAALTSVGSMLKPFNMTISQLAEWIWQKDALEQFIYILDDFPAEIGKVYSYIHYVWGMGLVTRNPFSAGINPELYALVHIAGNTLGVPRSLNALLPKGGVEPNVILNAAYMAYATSTTSEFRIGFHDQSGVADYARRIEEFRPDPNRPIVSQGGTHWFLQSKDQSVKAKVLKFAAARWRMLNRTRDLTIARFLNSLADSYDGLANEIIATQEAVVAGEAI